MDEFTSLEELKERIMPALNLKSTTNVSEDDIFNYLSEKKWKNSSDLRLFEIIDDIIKLNTEEMVMDDEK